VAPGSLLYGPGIPPTPGRGVGAQTWGWRPDVGLASALGASHWSAVRFVPWRADAADEAIFLLR